MDQARIVTQAPVRFAKKKIIAISVLATIIVVLIILSIIVEWEVPPSKETLYASGQHRALIIFHPSWKYHFQEELTAAFAKGLHTSDWAVDRITTSAKNLTDFYSYDMYIFGTNTYYWQPDLPTKKFLSETSLHQRPAIGIVSGPGYTERAEVILKDLLTQSQASSVTIFAFSLLRPSKESVIPDSNRQAAIKLAFQLGEVTGKTILTAPAR